MKIVRSVSFWLCYILWNERCIAERSQEEDIHQISSPVVGGYKAAKVDNPAVLGAADFAVETLSSSNLSFAESEASLRPRVLQAAQQVVAGMNYKLTIMLETAKDSKPLCVGAFDVTIYDHFGDLSVTNWGEEYSCSAAFHFLEGTEEEGSG